MNDKLYKILKKLESDSLQPEEMDFLLSYVFKIAKVYLTYKYKSSVLLDKKVVTVDELAINITANLFYKTGKGQTRFYKILSLQKKNIYSEKDICYFIYKIVGEEVDRIIMAEMLKWNLVPLEVYK